MTESLQARRLDLRVNLWNSRLKSQATSQDSFDRVKVLSPSLAACLQQRTTNDREFILTDAHTQETLEKWTSSNDFEYILTGNVTKTFLSTVLPYLRSSVVSESTAPQFVEHFKSLPKLRSIHLIEDNLEDQNAISKFFVEFAHQLRSFTYQGMRPVDLIASGFTMPRLKSLMCKIVDIPRLPRLTELPSIDRIIPWNELTTFGFQIHAGFNFTECYPVMQFLGEMTQLRKLAIWLNFKRPRNSNRRVALDVDLMKGFLTTEFSKIREFDKLEVLSLRIEPPHSDTTLDYRFVLDLLAPKLGASLKKLVFQVPRTLKSTSDYIPLDFSTNFAHLETLVLMYQEGHILYTGGPEDKRTPSLSIRHLTITNFTRNSLSKIFEQIPTVFPNLIELNLKALKGKRTKEVYGDLTDQDTSKMIGRLVHLRTLRFMDKYSKLASLYGSIELMCKRATELKPKVPMQFRVPIVERDFNHLKYVDEHLPDELKPFYCWQKMDKWIQLC